MADTEYRPPEWADIEAAGGEHEWIYTELQRRGLIEDDVDFSNLSEKQKENYKARRQQQRNVTKLLKKDVWAAYKAAHILHIGSGLYYSDDAESDRYDLESKDQRLRDNQLVEIKNANELAKLLELSIPQLRWLVYERSVDSGSHYIRWTIPKKDGTQRLISSPKPLLKKAQQWIAKNIVEHLPTHESAHGFVPGRSTVTNAMVHAAANTIVKMDIKDFYPTITVNRVKGIFRQAGYTEQVAILLALLCTDSPRMLVQHEGQNHFVSIGARSLPQGAVTSPSLTNTLCFKLDSRLTGLAAKKGIMYSRYADDLTFSFHTPPSKQEIASLMGAVHRIVESEGFVAHPKKTRVLRSGRRQKVTGLVVNKSIPSQPEVRVSRDVIRRLRASIKNRELGRNSGPETLEQLKGLAAYVHMSDPVKGKLFLKKIEALQKRSQA